MESVDLQGIVAFVQAVEAGSFTGAGERLHVTKSAIGKSVAQLSSGSAFACSTAPPAASARPAKA